MENNRVKDPVLSLRNISYAYEEEHPALKNIDLDIYAGEKLAVLGANGAGKSTLFLLLNGVLKPDIGSIVFQGEQITKKNLRELRKGVGIVFQEADNQMIAPTVRAEVSFGPMNLKLPEEEVGRRVLDALEFMELTDFQDRPPHYLSGGEKKRVSIADIIAMDPKVILFDEPASSLDPQNREKLERVLTQLSASGKTLVISTHDMDFAYRWADRIVVFQGGRLRAQGKPSEIFSQETLLAETGLVSPLLFQVEQMLRQKNLLKEISEDEKGGLRPLERISLMLKENEQAGRSGTV